MYVSFNKSAEQTGPENPLKWSISDTVTHCMLVQLLDLQHLRRKLIVQE